MARFNIDIGFTRKVPIAEEVLSGAYRVLATAGFADDEIRALFLQAAGEIVTQPGQDQEYFLADEEESYARDRRYDLEDELEKTAAFKALQRLAKRHERTWQYETLDELSKGMDGLREAVPHGETIQSWIRANSSKFGLTVRDNHDRWVETATDEELDREDQFAFLDDWRFRTPFPWEIASSLARDFARRGMKERLDDLGALLLNSSMVFPGDIVEQVEAAKLEVQLFETFKAYLDGLAGSGELMRSQVTDDFVRNGQAVQSYLLDGWLETISSENPNVQVYKRSNRWRVLVD